MIEEKKRLDYENNNSNRNRLSKSSFNLNYSNQMNNSFYGSKKLMKLNSGAILNSLADYSLNNLEDKMLQLDIKSNRNQPLQQQIQPFQIQPQHQLLQQQHSIDSNMYKNVSFESLKNLNNRKLKNNKLNWNDQFEAYRLENDQPIEVNSTGVQQKKEINNSQEENNNINKSNENNKNNNNKKETQTETSSTTKPKKKPTRHHHHRSKRHNKNKDPSNQKEDTMRKSKSNSVILEQINQDSLSAFDFSNTDDFWEDDIVANSELIGTDSFHLLSHRSSPITHFISIIDLDEDDSI